MTNQSVITGFHGLTGAREFSNDAAIEASFGLIRQLRTSLKDADQWLKAFKRQAADGYRIMLVINENTPRALAGFRVQENLIHGKFLYVDDLVTDVATRSTGLGTQLIDALIAEARSSHCDRLVLDTAITNLGAQRFYSSCGMSALATRFVISVGETDEAI